MRYPSPRLLIALGVLVASASAQQLVVVPAAYQTVDAPARLWVAGACMDQRHQILVGPTHLASQAGHSITAMDFHRSAKNEAFQGGSMNLTITLSTTTRAAVECSETYADNIGSNATQVFQGTVTVPTSPATAEGPGTVVPWSANNVIHIQFAQPFLYSGGTLCIDILGTKISGQTADWWEADAAYDFAKGATVDIGPGCGPYANAQGQWSSVEAHTLVPGGTMSMRSHGTEGDLVVAVTGQPAAAWPLSLIGLGQPGCNAYLGSSDFLEFRVFTPIGIPQLAHRGGEAEFNLHVPNATWVLGGQMATQWLDLTALESSNAVLWTISSQPMTLDMALVDGVPAEATGNVSTWLAHVLRFEIQ